MTPPSIRTPERVPLCAVAVVVPARNEAELLGACLASVQVALARAEVPRRLAVVVADHCTDATAEIAAAAGALVVVRDGADRGSVGQARAAGCSAVLDRWADLPDDAVWLAHTDADSRVPPHWLTSQLEAAAAGHHAVAGRVALALDGGHDRHDRWRSAYALAGGAGVRPRRHSHVHGANLGVRADAYRSVGGFAKVALDEDLGLVERLIAAGHPTAWPDEPRVLTSARLDGRAPGGLAADLRSLA